MKRYSFRMEQVLRVRRLQEEAARSGVAVARTAERTAESALAASQQHYRALEEATPASDAAAFLGMRDRVAFRAGGVKLAEGQLANANEATAVAVDAWRVEHRRVDALERLDARRREEHAVEARRAEDAVVDEIVVARARSSA